MMSFNSNDAAEEKRKDGVMTSQHGGDATMTFHAEQSPSPIRTGQHQTPFVANQKENFPYQPSSSALHPLPTGPREAQGSRYLVSGGSMVTAVGYMAQGGR